jgi:putative AlgH/UPF0301 family transcriptional regulator
LGLIPATLCTDNSSIRHWIEEYNHDGPHRASAYRNLFRSVHDTGMIARKLCFFLMLTAIVAFAAVEEVRPPVPEFSRTAPASLRLNSETPPAVLVPSQSTNIKDLAAGKLLVASRRLSDPHFVRTVILILHYNQDGVAGLILNRRTSFPLSRLTKELSGYVYLGGPVSTHSTFALLETPAKLEGAEHIFDRVHLITSKTLFEKTISGLPDPSVFHVYQGYAGWVPGQLEREIARGDWFIFPGSVDAVFTADPDSLWSRMIQKTEWEMAQSNADAAGWEHQTCATAPVTWPDACPEAWSQPLTPNWNQDAACAEPGPSRKSRLPNPPTALAVAAYTSTQDCFRPICVSPTG